MVSEVKAKAKTAKQKRAEDARQAGQISMFDNFDIHHPDNALYSALATEEELFEWLTYLDDATQICLDIETGAQAGRPKSSLNPWEGWVRLIQVGLPDGRVLILDTLTCRERLCFGMLIERIGELCESPDCLIVGQSLKFEMTFLGHHYGYKFNRIADTEIMSRLYWAGLENFGERIEHSMLAIAARTLGVNVDKTEQTSAWANPRLTQDQLEYAVLDVRIPFGIMNKMIPLLRREELFTVAQIEFNALICYAEMELAGAPIDYARLCQLIDLYSEALAEARIPYDTQFPGIGLHSSKKSKRHSPADGFLGDGYYEESLGSEYDFPDGLHEALHALTGEWAPSLDANYLEPMSRLRNPDGELSYPSIDSLLVSRAITTTINYLTKIKQGYMGGVIRQGYRSLAPQGRGRSTSGSAGEGSAPAHRLKSGEVITSNVQNCPTASKARYKDFVFRGEHLPDIRSVFSVGNPAEKDGSFQSNGRSMECHDYSAAHGRIASVVTKDPVFIASYNDPTIDNHCDLAAVIARQNGYDWTGAQLKAYRKDPNFSLIANGFRNVSKNCFYLWLNGGGVGRTKSTVESGGFQCPDPSEIIGYLRSKFPGVAQFHDQIKSMCRDKDRFRSFPSIGVKQQHVKFKAGDGRIVWVPVRESDYGPACNPNDAMMIFWMSVESSAKKKALWEMRQLFNANPEWQGYCWLDCHDEIGTVCSAEWAHICHPLCADIMDNSLAHYLEGLIPAYETKYEFTSIKHNWGECK